MVADVASDSKRAEGASVTLRSPAMAPNIVSI